MISSRLKNLLWIASEKGAYLATSLVSFVFFAWYLSPVEFGKGILCVSIVELIALVITSYVDDAMVRRNNLDDEYLRSIFWFGSAFCFLSCLILLIIINLYTDDGRFVLLVAFCSLKIPIIFFGRIDVAKCRRSRNFKLLAKRTFWGKLAGTVLGVFSAIGGLKEFSLVVQVVTIEVISTAMLFLSNKSFYALPKNSGYFKEIVIDGFPQMIKHVTADFINRGTILILGALAGPSVVGIYAFAYRLVELPRGLIQTGVFSYALPAFSTRNTDAEKIKKFFLDASEYMAFALIGVFFLLASISDYLINFIFSYKWNGSIFVTQWFYVLAGFGFLTFLSSPLLISLGKNKILIVGEVIVSTISMAVLFLFSKEFGLVSAIAARSLYSGFLFLLHVYAVSVDARICKSVFVFKILKPLLCGVIMLGVDFLYRTYFPLVSVFDFFVKTFFLAFVYIATVLFVRKKILSDFKCFFYDPSK